MRQGLTAALNKGAEAILATNDHADRTAVLSGDTTKRGGDAEPATLKDLCDLIKGIPRAKGGGGNPKGGGGNPKGGGDPDDTRASSRMVKLPNSKSQLFKRVRGGNPECPVKCTRRRAGATSTTPTSRRWLPASPPLPRAGWEREIGRGMGLAHF